MNLYIHKNGFYRESALYLTEDDKYFCGFFIVGTIAIRFYEKLWNRLEQYPLAQYAIEYGGNYRKIEFKDLIDYDWTDLHFALDPNKLNLFSVLIKKVLTEEAKCAIRETQ